MSPNLSPKKDNKIETRGETSPKKKEGFASKAAIYPKIPYFTDQ
jgi:hypothetical protein